jgi:hypothetical protein
MLRQLKHFALRYAALRLPALLLAVLMVPVIAWILFTSDTQAQDMYLIPALVPFAWLLLLFAMLSLFPAIPDRAARDLPWHQRFPVAWRRGLYALLAGLMLMVTLGLLVITLQLLGAWRRMY